MTTLQGISEVASLQNRKADEAVVNVLSWDGFAQDAEGAYPIQLTIDEAANSGLRSADVVVCLPSAEVKDGDIAYIVYKKDDERRDAVGRVYHLEGGRVYVNTENDTGAEHLVPRDDIVLLHCVAYFLEKL